MAEATPANPQNASPFTKYFLPGLVLGLIVGAFAGVVLTPILGGNPLPKPTGISPSTTHVPREGERDESPGATDQPASATANPDQSKPADRAPDEGTSPKKEEAPK